ncbi:troponin C, isoallergen Bla g 6.0201-like [Microplitis mediator]|uniref:troponin C, isoallergen Bla g 6.0201-like n=1 Tax=Microplitis mediator TaxID=375433 RepID=UPI002554252C|nr:troponin C, isoallergen Bla g 6.0201-like [Microplitis mediator]
MEPGQLSKDQKKQLQTAFDAFDKEKKGIIATADISIIIGMMGIETETPADLDNAIAEVDTFGAGEVRFEDFCTIVSRFMEEDVDVEALKSELKEAFRLYDREGNGYITTECFREILSEIDENLNDDELDMMIEEIDADGSGTLDFEEFVEAMTH